ncbi:SDR family oxidoreductase [Roseibium polysiphoniae]|uniref:SDR family oxidoreductase n=1 Tax=Roseibium polysiphoniae TaxID=2571221 RepID=A0ABR9C8J9_9HYPH|nr:SDR family oxidoreductase [Roseibium polysiphoniae]MBD8875226.1 SDR family oxidoreductase [Roseibium polysiphoniae]
MRFEDKTIIVTGASSGIGAAAARLLSEAGANLILAARREAILEEVCQSLGEGASRAVVLSGDVTDESYNKALVHLAVERFGGLNAAFNNAGAVGDMSDVPAMSYENWQAVLKTNLDSAFLAAKYQVPAIEAQGGGSIVFTSSFVGHTIGFPGMGAYAAAKAGLVGLTQVLAAEHGANNLRVNALLPGGTLTDMAGSDPEFHAFISGLHALKRMAKAEEIASTARYLLSDEASFITGAALLCDGGNSIYKV